MLSLPSREKVWLSLIWYEIQALSNLAPAIRPAHLKSLLLTFQLCQYQQLCLEDTFPRRLLDFKAYPVLSSRKPCTPVFFPIRVTLCDSHPPACSFRAEIIFIHVTRCLVHGTFPQCWLNEHRAWDTGHLESLDRVRRMPSLVYKGLLRLHYSCSNPLHCVDTLLLILLNI